MGRFAQGAAALGVMLAVGAALAASTAVDDVVFKDLQDREVTLRQFKGKVVLVHVFATWDMQGLRGVPDLGRIHKERKDVQVVGVAVDGVQETRAFLNVFNPAYPVWRTGAAFTEGRTPFGLTREVPRLFVVGPDGKLKDGFVGYVPYPNLVELVDRYRKK